MDRIYFVDNPWPNGHRIMNFEWSAHLKLEDEKDRNIKAGLYFDFHLETADYDEEDLEDEEDGDEDEEIDDWHAKIVWNNYHSCTLSSQEWDDKGFLVGSAADPFDFEKLDGMEYAVDFLSSGELEDLDLDLTAFDVYLLGHDASAFHRIEFKKLENQSYQINWSGKLAQAYIGDYEFRYDFHTTISSALFTGITIPDEITDSDAYGLLGRFVKDTTIYKLQNQNGNRKFVLR